MGHLDYNENESENEYESHSKENQLAVNSRSRKGDDEGAHYRITP